MNKCHCGRVCPSAYPSSSKIWNYLTNLILSLKTGKSLPTLLTVGYTYTLGAYRIVQFFHVRWFPASGNAFTTPSPVLTPFRPSNFCIVPLVRFMATCMVVDTRCCWCRLLEWNCERVSDTAVGSTCVVEMGLEPKPNRTELEHFSWWVRFRTFCLRYVIVRVI